MKDKKVKIKEKLSSLEEYIFEPEFEELEREEQEKYLTARNILRQIK